MKTSRRDLFKAALGFIAAAVVAKKAKALPPRPKFHVVHDYEITQSSGDILEDKYRHGIEEIMKAEDERFLELCRRAA